MRCKIRWNGTTRVGWQLYSLRAIGLTIFKRPVVSLTSFASPAMRMMTSVGRVAGASRRPVAARCDSHVIFRPILRCGGTAARVTDDVQNAPSWSVNERKPQGFGEFDHRGYAHVGRYG